MDGGTFGRLPENHDALPFADADRFYPSAPSGGAGRGQSIGVIRVMHDFLAYIDPGSGSLIIQAVIAGIVAIPFFFRQQIGRFVRSVRKTDTPADGDTPQPTDRAS